MKDSKIDPKVKKRVLADIKKLQAQAKEYSDLSENCADANMIRKIYYGFVYEVLGGDIRHFLYTASDAENFKNRIDAMNPMKKVKFK